MSEQTQREGGDLRRVRQSWSFTRCAICAAMIWVDPGEERPTSDERQHADWHEEIDRRVRNAGRRRLYR